MMVMMIAITPSLKASSRALCMRKEYTVPSGPRAGFPPALTARLERRYMVRHSRHRKSHGAARLDQRPEGRGLAIDHPGAAAGSDAAPGCAAGAPARAVRARPEGPRRGGAALVVAGPGLCGVHPRLGRRAR